MNSIIEIETLFCVFSMNACLFFEPKTSEQVKERLAKLKSSEQ